jgi:hypothetical protein
MGTTPPRVVVGKRRNSPVGGGRANGTVAHELAKRLGVKVMSENFAIRYPPDQGASVFELSPDRLREEGWNSLMAPAIEQTINGWKLSQSLPPDFAIRFVRARFADARGVGGVSVRTTRIVIES